MASLLAELLRAKFPSAPAAHSFPSEVPFPANSTKGAIPPEAAISARFLGLLTAKFHSAPAGFVFAQHLPRKNLKGKST